MGISRYAVSIGEEMPLGCKIYEPTHPHFLTCTVLHGLLEVERLMVLADSNMHPQAGAWGRVKFGHAVFGDGDDYYMGQPKMRNVILNENPIAREMGLPARTAY